MKKILFLLLIPFSISAQVVSADFVVINEGMDASYHDLEKIWSVYHMESIKKGEKIAWSVWKRTPREGDVEKAADYVIFNQFSSKDQHDKMLNSFDMKKATSIMKNGLKGKMSSSKINKTLNKNIKKEVRNYTLQLVDAFPLMGGDIKVGDKMNFATMIQKDENYEEYESKVWKPVFQNEALRGNFKWWALTRIVDRNDKAYKPPTHLVWNIGVENAQDFMPVSDFIDQEMRDLRDSYREMGNTQELTLVYTSNN